MSRDLFSKKPGRRNWARGSVPASHASPHGTADASLVGSVPPAAKKIALGAMALGTLAGLAFITSPWWRPLPRQPDLHRNPMRKRIYLSPGTTANRVMWSRH